MPQTKFVLKKSLELGMNPIVLINKIDILHATNFRIKKVKADISKLNKKTKIFLVSAKTGEGMKQWCDWLLKLAVNKRTKTAKKTRSR